MRQHAYSSHCHDEAGTAPPSLSVTMQSPVSTPVHTPVGFHGGMLSVSVSWSVNAFGAHLSSCVKTSHRRNSNEHSDSILHKYNDVLMSQVSHYHETSTPCLKKVSSDASRSPCRHQGGCMHVYLCAYLLFLRSFTVCSAFQCLAVFVALHVSIV